MARINFYRGTKTSYNTKQASTDPAEQLPQDSLIFTTDTNEIFLGGNRFGANQYKEVTYDQLRELRDTALLVPGTFYRLTDYKCTTTQENTQAAAHYFDIIILALDSNVLSEKCWATKHAFRTQTADGKVIARPVDYYKNSNLEKWQIWYTLENDTEKFMWADPENGRGVIYRMIDEYGNDCPYDFKNIQFKRFLITGLNTASMLPAGFTFDSYAEFVNLSNLRLLYLASDSTDNRFVVNSEIFTYRYTFDCGTTAAAVDQTIAPIVSGVDVAFLSNIGDPTPHSNIIKPAYKVRNIDNKKIVSTQILNNIVFTMCYGLNSTFNDYRIFENRFDNNCSNMTLTCWSYQNNFGKETTNLVTGPCLTGNNIEGEDMFLCGNIAENTIKGNTIYMGHHCYYNNIINCNDIAMKNGLYNNITDSEIICLGSESQYINIKADCSNLYINNKVSLCDIDNSVYGFVIPNNTKNVHILPFTRHMETTPLNLGDKISNTTYPKCVGTDSNGNIVVWNPADSTVFNII